MKKIVICRNAKALSDCRAFSLETRKIVNLDSSRLPGKPQRIIFPNLFKVSSRQLELPVAIREQKWLPYGFFGMTATVISTSKNAKQKAREMSVYRRKTETNVHLITRQKLSTPLIFNRIRTSLKSHQFFIFF